MATKKQIKKSQQINNAKIKSEQNEIQRLIRIILIVVGVFLVFTLITYLVEKNKTKTETEETKIQYDAILLGSLLDLDGSYNVIITNEKDPDITLYESYATYALKKDSSFRLYYSYLDEVFNQQFVGEESNIKKDNFKVSTTTLIKVENGEIKAYYEGKAKITKYLQNLIK